MNLADLLLRNADLDALPNVDFLPCKMTSTYDKTGGNSDGADYLRWEGDRAVLCDVQGPGAIVRFYVARANGTLFFYFDGEAKPRLEIDCVKFFSGEAYPFIKPLVDKRGLGLYCYFPFPFAKSCRIECAPGTNGERAIYSQLTHIAFPEGTPVKTFAPELANDEKAALERVLAAWRKPGVHPAGERPGQKTIESKFTVPPRDLAIVADLKGSGVVDALYLKLNTQNTDLLREVLIRCYWDGLMRPGIDSPVGDFFGNAFEFHPFRGLLTGLSEEGEYYCYFPMPFAAGAQFEIVNDSNERLDGVELRLVYRDTPAPAPNVGRFHAKWRREYTMEVDVFHANLDGRYNYTILDAAGQGKYCGCSMQVLNSWPRWWGEGDEMIFVDGDTWPPSHHGTGTEEYFNDAWGFHEGICPVSGAMLAGPLEGPSGLRCYGPNALFTHHIANAVPFSEHIRVTIEHGTENDKSNDYATTAYWYQRVPGQDFFVMPRVQERLVPEKEKWIQRYRQHRQEFVRDRLGKVAKYMQLFAAQPTTEANMPERIHAMTWWHYYMRITDLKVVPERREIEEAFKGRFWSLPLEERIKTVDDMAAALRRSTEQRLKGK